MGDAAMSVLFELTQSAEDKGVRRNAAESLGKMEDVETVTPVLVELARNAEYGIEINHFGNIKPRKQNYCRYMPEESD